MPLDLTRRELLRTALGAAALAALDGCGDSQVSVQSSSSTTAGYSPPRAFRFVHLTDIHVQHERDGDKGFAQALKAVESLRPKPDFILTGGDLIFDGLDVSSQRTRELFELFNKVLEDNTSLPIHHTIGNHDVYGWGRKSGATPGTPGYGKAMCKDYLRLTDTFHRFDHKGWRFFCLDNIQPGGNERYPYEGFIDGPQLDWLKAELAATDPRMPVIMCEHIPMVTATQFDHPELVKEKEWRVSNAFVCSDAAQRLELYKGHGIRLCLSGHIHERDRVEFCGPAFINDGAVCGSWWKGPHHGVQEGFGVIDCRADGTFDHRYLDYGWEVRKEARTS